LDSCGYLTSPGLHNVAVNCTQLQELNIQESWDLSDDSISHVLASGKGRLRKLIIAGHMLATPTARMSFYGLGSSLEHLSISCGMWQVSPKLISQYLPGVKYLKITQDGGTFKLLNDALGCHNLEELFLRDSGRSEMISSTADLDLVVQCISLHTLCLINVVG